VGNQLVLPYAERLRLLPDYLQQLTMESNGKSVHTDGTPVSVHTMPVLWGGTGTNGQHAFHQLLHQGTRSFAADFIVVANAPGPPAQRRWLLANALAQSQAMQLGHEDEDPHKRVPGRHATSTIVLERLDPATLGALLAFYEHTVFCQGVMWDINSFDQWGVELGKRLALPISEQLAGKSALGQDRATRLLIEHLQRTLKT
jgi:glucose-6-phosphate isomerase